MVKTKGQMVSVIRGDDDSTKFYTGRCHMMYVFTALLEYMQPLVEKLHQTSSGTEGRKRSLMYEEELLAILMRLHLGLLFLDLLNLLLCQNQHRVPLLTCHCQYLCVSRE